MERQDKMSIILLNKIAENKIQTNNYTLNGQNM